MWFIMAEFVKRKNVHSKQINVGNVRFRIYWKWPLWWMLSVGFLNTSPRFQRVVFCRLGKHQSVMMTSSNENIFRVTGLLCGEFTSHRWIPLTKASDAELWCICALNKRLSKQSWDWWFETPSRSLWRHCNHRKDTWSNVVRSLFNIGLIGPT